MASRPGPVDRLRGWARAVRRDGLALWLAARDPRVPRGARLLCWAVAAYALSPIDLIPDAVPVLGLLDEAVLLPLAILLMRRLVPAPLMAELRARADAMAGRPAGRAGAAAVVALWLLGALALAWALWPA